MNKILSRTLKGVGILIVVVLSIFIIFQFFYIIKIFNSFFEKPTMRETKNFVFIPVTTTNCEDNTSILNGWLKENDKKKIVTFQKISYNQQISGYLACYINQDNSGEKFKIVEVEKSDSSSCKIGSLQNWKDSADSDSLLGFCFFSENKKAFIVLYEKK